MANNPSTDPSGGVPVAPAAPRERFVLDDAHVGDIQGAFGTIKLGEEG